MRRQGLQGPQPPTGLSLGTPRRGGGLSAPTGVGRLSLPRGGTPEQQAARYAEASPRALLPLAFGL